VALTCEAVGHRFGRQRLFAQVDFSLSGRGSVCVAGPNGSGKSTLMRILAGVLEPSAGRVTWTQGDRVLERQERHRRCGFVSPDVHYYGELTVLENLRFFARLRGLSGSDETASALLERFELAREGHQPYATLSSGQKQRVRYVAALQHAPAVLLLDEPTANLDRSGRRLVADVVETQTREGLLVVATNEEEEYRFGQTLVRIRD
jgi:heme exporter protein A